MLVGFLSLSPDDRELNSKIAELVDALTAY